MGVLGNTFGLPVTGPLRGLAWLARQIAEAASREMADPARIESDLLALERQLNDGEIDEPTFEAREAELLARLAEIVQAGEAGTSGETVEGDEAAGSEAPPP